MPNNDTALSDQDYLKALSVLYVEDDDDTREELAEFLRRRLARVYTAAHGQAGLEAFLQYQPDLVITDIRMPVMDGLAMAERIRATRPKTPIIITTAFEETRYFQQAIDLGVDKYVIKPVKPDILAKALLECARLTRAEAALREVNERYQLLFQLSHVAISVAASDSCHDPSVLLLNGRIVDCNAAFLTLLGYAGRDELSDRLFGDLLAPEAVGVINPLVRDELLVRGFTRECDLELRHKDGSATPVIAQFILRRDALGQPKETWAVMRDLAEQRRAEQALRLAALVFDNSGEAIYITDPDNRILSVNRAFSSMTGYLQQEVIGQNPRLLKSDQQDAGFYRQMWQSLTTTGHWQGELQNRRKNGEIYSARLSITVVRDAQGQVVNYIAICSDLSATKVAADNIEFLSHYDPLTRLVNRQFLEDWAKQLILMATRNETKLALLFINLDRFHNINDSLGHRAGDAILETVAQRLRAMLREVDLIARLSADEFIVMLPTIAGVSDATAVARKLLAAVGEPITVAEHTLTITASVGISLYPLDGDHYEILLKNADTAMCNAKKAGRNNFMFFAQDMNNDAIKQLQLETALRRALNDQEFELHYQPQVAIHSGRIIGMEALLRWRSVELGMVPPGRFIPLAEDTGLIVPIGEWVLREACRQNAEWQRQGLPAVLIAVNLSALQFRQKNLMELVQGALTAHGLSPRFLELELTESMMMQDVEYAIHSLCQLKQLGAQLALDDFGTGYSSLAYLKRFEINKLKIDQSFVHDLSGHSDDDKIVKAIIGLAHTLNLTVIAEGVETQQQQELLRTYECDEIQGYYYSRPVPAAEMAKLLKQESSVKGAGD